MRQGASNGSLDWRADDDTEDESAPVDEEAAAALEDPPASPLALLAAFVVLVSGADDEGESNLDAVVASCVCSTPDESFVSMFVSSDFLVVPGWLGAGTVAESVFGAGG